MTCFTDHKRTVSIELKNWDETSHNWSPDWSADFYEVGGLVVAAATNDGVHVYEVEDIDYLLDYAGDMLKGVGDFDTPSPDTSLFVTDLD